MNKKHLLTTLISIFAIFCVLMMHNSQDVKASVLDSFDLEGEVSVMGMEAEMGKAVKKSILKDGMVLVPGGNIELGAGVDPIWGDSIPRKLVALSPFWMDETEVTNAEYREFVYWVRDSIIRTLLADPALGADPSYRLQPREGEEGRYMPLNWRKNIPWGNPNRREELVINTITDPAPYSADGASLNTRLLNYKYDWFDSKSYYSFLSQFRNRENPMIMVSKDTAYVNAQGSVVRETLTRVSYGARHDFTNTYIIGVYPDVLSWMTDFSNAKNEQYVKNYFHAVAFDDFPVVGVSWEQADAYCAWRTRMFTDSNPNYEDFGFEVYRLPTEAEWEFAARNGRSELKYPWISDGTHTDKGMANSNFRDSKNLKDLTSPVGSFDKNRFGLADMAGNVAEWTTTTYSESVDLMTDEVNPDYSYRAVTADPDILKRKIVKGGSWKDTENFIRADVRAVEYQNRGRSYIGFRCVRSWGIDARGRLNK